MARVENNGKNHAVHEQNELLHFLIYSRNSELLAEVIINDIIICANIVTGNRLSNHIINFSAAVYFLFNFVGFMDYIRGTSLLYNLRIEIL